MITVGSGNESDDVIVNAGDEGAPSLVAVVDDVAAVASAFVELGLHERVDELTDGVDAIADVAQTHIFMSDGLIVHGSGSAGHASDAAIFAEFIVRRDGSCIQRTETSTDVLREGINADKFFDGPDAEEIVVAGAAVFVMAERVRRIGIDEGLQWFEFVALKKRAPVAKLPWNGLPRKREVGVIECVHRVSEALFLVQQVIKAHRREDGTDPKAGGCLHGIDAGTSILRVAPGAEFVEARLGEANLFCGGAPAAGAIPLVAVKCVVYIFFLLLVVACALLVEAFVNADEASHGTEVAALAFHAKALGVIAAGHEAHAYATELTAADDAAFLLGNLHEDLRVFPRHADEICGVTVALERTECGWKQRYLR